MTGSDATRCRLTRSIAGLAIAGLAITGVAASEVAHWIVGGNQIPVGRSTVLVVLGFPTRRNGKPHPVQTGRVKLAISTAQAHKPEMIIFSGGMTSGEQSEAEAMAEIMAAMWPNTASEPMPRLVTESRARSTWENVWYTRKLLDTTSLSENQPTIIVVSQPLHAARARRYWLRQDPTGAKRVFVTDCSLPMKGVGIKAFSAMVEAQHLATGTLRDLVDRSRN